MPFPVISIAYKSMPLSPPWHLLSGLQWCHPTTDVLHCNSGRTVLETLIVLSHLHGVDKLNESGKILFLLRGLIVDIPDEGGIEQRFGLLPEIVPAFAVPLGVGDQGVHQLQNVLFAVDIGERIIVH